MSIRSMIYGAALAVLVAGSLGANSASAQTDAKPTDPQIAHIVYTADTIDIQNGQLAVKKSKNASIRGFAEDMVRDHTAVNQMALALAKKLNIKPEDNATSKALVKQAAAEHAKLSKLNGPAFDKAYAANEVAFHKEVNDALETTLIPSAQNPQLKNLLETGLKMFQGHEQHAETVLAGLK